MGPEAKTEPNFIPLKLHLTSLPTLKSPQNHSGSLTPHHTSASVPFSWEQEPGKPLPCLTLALPLSHDNVIKCLELPPRLRNETIFAKTPSPKTPTTILEGPYSNSLGKSILKSSSFKFLRKRRKSFDGVLSFVGKEGSSSPERGLISNISRSGEKMDKGLFGTWRKKGGVNLQSKSEAHGGSFVFSSFSDDGASSGSGSCCDGGTPLQVGRVSKRNQLGCSKSKSHLWAIIYGTFKQVMPTSTKWKKDDL